jgi:hypothetical protein
MLSAAALYWPSRDKIVRRSFPSAREVFLDSGGFVAHRQYGGFPWSIDDYLALVFARRPDFAASMDYPCEADLRRANDLRSNFQRIDATVQNALALYPWSDSRTRFVPVVQGYTLEEYRYCISRYADAGLYSPVFAVGSMCRRMSGDELQAIIEGIGMAVTSLLGYRPRLHWFGLHMRALSTPARKWIDSWDSTAWAMPPDARKYAHRSEYPDLFSDYEERLKGLDVSY